MFAIQIDGMTFAFDVDKIPRLHLMNAADLTKRGAGSRQVMAFALLALGAESLAAVAARLPGLGYDLGRLGEAAFDTLLGAGIDARGAEGVIWGAVSQHLNAQRVTLSEATAPPVRPAAAPATPEAPARRPSAENGDPPRYGPEGNGPRKLPKALQEAAKT